MAEVPRYYWDSCVFLSYIDEQSGRLEDLRALLVEAKRREIEIVTSAVSITEVAFGSVERDQSALLPEVQARINGLWLPSSPIKLAEVSQLVVEDAREIMRDAIAQGTKVAKPMDAIHVSTALRLQAGILHTYDEDLQKIAARAGLVSSAPMPASGPQLPMDSLWITAWGAKPRLSRLLDELKEIAPRIGGVL
jgi:predicted nucleic acid-binding protein